MLSLRLLQYFAPLSPSLPQSTTQITKLHSSLSRVCSVLQLRVLDVSSNRLVSFDCDKMGKLVALETLILNNNKLTSLSACLNKLPSLTQLSLHRNCITSNQVASDLSGLFHHFFLGV